MLERERDYITQITPRCRQQQYLKDILFIDEDLKDEFSAQTNFANQEQPAYFLPVCSLTVVKDFYLSCIYQQHLQVNFNKTGSVTCPRSQL
jgi:hypothetical protein